MTTDFAQWRVAMIAWPLVRLLRSVRDRAEAVDSLLDASAMAMPSSSDAYVRRLSDVYGFIGGLAPTLRSSLFAMARIHARGASVLDELQAWGTSNEAAAKLPRLAQRMMPQTPRTELEALGCVFVVERMYLQVERMRCKLSGAPEPDEREAWLELGRLFTRMVTSESDVRVLEASTRAAFDVLEDWLLVNAANDVQVQFKQLQLA